MEEFLEMRNGRKKMATYVISDIHGEYEKFMELLEEIELEENDTLYVLGGCSGSLGSIRSKRY